MSEYGITENGFNRKRLDTIVEEIETKMRTIFGENINLEPESIDGQDVALTAAAYADLWELAELAYNAFDPSSVVRDGLSKLVRLNRLRRLEQVNSTVNLTVSGDIGSIIPAGSIFSTDDIGNQFGTDEEATIGNSGSVIINATALESGEIIGAAGTITVVETALAGNISVNNIADASLGSEEETDPELRARRDRSTGINGTNVLDAIQANVANLDGVTDVDALENRTKVTDANGLPPSSFSIIVQGGDDDEIAQTIYDRYPSGIEHFGSTSAIAFDLKGRPRIINFARPTTIDIYVIVNITRDSDYPATGDDQIAQAIVDYAEGVLIANRGFGLADNVVHSRLYTAINSIAGHSVDSLFIGTSASPTSANDIAITADEIAGFSTANITVN